MAKKPDIDQAVIQAKYLKRQTGKEHYVVVNFAGNIFVTNLAPTFGEWYTDDGIKHGENP